jgi:hypothetical protein
MSILKSPAADPPQISRNDKNKQLTLLRQRKMALTGRHQEVFLAL